MMRAASVERMMREIGEDDLVLDLGEYETRGRNGSQGGDVEHFTAPRRARAQRLLYRLADRLS